MTQQYAVPFLDLTTIHASLRDRLTNVFQLALSTASFVGGKAVETFEGEFAKYCGVEHCIGVNSGTDALRFALMAAGVGDGDAAITAPNSFIATAEAISQSGARPIFVDVDSSTFNLDPVKLRQYLDVECQYDSVRGGLVDRKTDRRVAAIVPVHLYGQVAEMDQILRLGEEYGLAVIEDACQAHGAEYYSFRHKRWLKAGSMGTAAAFSFYPGKNLGACGEGGAITTNDGEVARKVRMLRDHGQTAKYHHEIVGYNGRLDAVQAGFLSVKLPYLPEWNELRRQAARTYDRFLESSKPLIIPPSMPELCRPSHHLYVIRTRDREGLSEHLLGCGIGTAIHYPIPIHLTQAYRSLGYVSGDFPVAEQSAAEVLSLPMFPGITVDQQEQVAEQISSYLSAKTEAVMLRDAARTRDSSDSGFC